MIFFELERQNVDIILQLQLKIRELLDQLIQDCVTSGDILVYNISFERGKLKDLIEVFPKYLSELRVIISRLKDLMLPFQKKWYYTPEMKGSYSIKFVLPALVPELSYNDLEIKEGVTVSNTFLSMVICLKPFINFLFIAP